MALSNGTLYELGCRACALAQFAIRIARYLRRPQPSSHPSPQYHRVGDSSVARLLPHCGLRFWRLQRAAHLRHMGRVCHVADALDALSGRACAPRACNPHRKLRRSQLSNRAIHRCSLALDLGLRCSLQVVNMQRGERARVARVGQWPAFSGQRLANGLWPGGIWRPMEATGQVSGPRVSRCHFPRQAAHKIVVAKRPAAR